MSEGAYLSRLIHTFSDYTGRNKRSINEMINAASTGLADPFDISFNVDIETVSPTSRSLTSFAVSHIIASYPAEEKLQDWCKTQAMIPWIAVAAQILVSFKCKDL